MNGRIDPRLFDEPALRRGADWSREVLALPMRAWTKTEIEEHARHYIETMLEQTSSAELYVATKQLEYAARSALDALRERAFNSIGEHLTGRMEGTILGAGVRIYYVKEWLYSSAIAALKEEQRTALKAAELAEQATGRALVAGERGVITVTLKGRP